VREAQPGDLARSAREPHLVLIVLVRDDRARGGTVSDQQHVIVAHEAKESVHLGSAPREQHRARARFHAGRERYRTCARAPFKGANKK
jgi:hypothetical protein